jgi:hypothetical protein
MRWIVLLLALAAAAPAASAADRERPVVIELFTSQGCNSCPPADAFLGELAREPGIVALSLHVDYWDYIGWKDPFAQRAHTKRQRSYSRALNQRYVYTPQMVVDGAWHGNGADRDKIRALIATARKARNGAPALSLHGDGPARTLRIGQGKAEAAAAVWLAVFESRHETEVTAGENDGKRLANYNVVRALKRVGEWSGAPAEIPLDLAGVPPACDGGAILVQSGETGPILAVLRIDLERR